MRLVGLPFFHQSLKDATPPPLCDWALVRKLWSAIWIWKKCIHLKQAKPATFPGWIHTIAFSNIPCRKGEAWLPNPGCSKLTEHVDAELCCWGLACIWGNFHKISHPSGVIFRSLRVRNQVDFTSNCICARIFFTAHWIDLTWKLFFDFHL